MVGIPTRNQTHHGNIFSDEHNQLKVLLERQQAVQRRKLPPRGHQPTPCVPRPPSPAPARPPPLPLSLLPSGRDPFSPLSWDSYLIRTLQSCPSFKAVLTTYPVGYELPHKIPAGETRPTLLVPDGFGPDGMLRQTGRLLLRKARDPLPSPLWAAGFSFSASALFIEVCTCVAG